MLIGLWADCMIGTGCALVCTNISGGWYNLTVRHRELDRVGGVGWDWYAQMTCFIPFYFPAVVDKLTG
jgi:hypothetical protein